jgi:transposase
MAVNGNNENPDDEKVMREIAVRAVADGMSTYEVIQWLSTQVHSAYEEYERAELKALDIENGTEPDENPMRV